MLRILGLLPALRRGQAGTIRGHGPLQSLDYLRRRALHLIWCAATNPADPGICKSTKHSKPCRHSEDLTPLDGERETMPPFFCSLCEAEVLKNSKHCRACDKCVDGFDHHCRWLNNCIGNRNYKGFFILMSSAVLLLVVQWLSGILVIILCIVKRGEFSRLTQSLESASQL